MKVTTFLGVVENGQIRLDADVQLPEKATVYVVIPDFALPQTSYVGSPRHVHPEQAADFNKQIVGRIVVEEKLQEALASGDPKVVDDSTWAKSEKRVAERIKSASKQRRADGNID